MDIIPLFELFSVSDSGGPKVKFFQISIVLTQYEFISRSQYFVYPVLSVNHFDWNKWLSERCGDLKYVQLLESTQIEMIVCNNAWNTPTT